MSPPSPLSVLLFSAVLGFVVSATVIAVTIWRSRP